MTQPPHEILKQTTFYSDGQPYAFVQLPPAAITAAAGLVASIGRPFCGLIADKDEVSLMIPAEAWAEFRHRLVNSQTAVDSYRLITFDIVLEPDLVGFMAYVSAALAEAGVTIMPFAAYSRDHLFVQENQFEQALTVLESLKGS